MTVLHLGGVHYRPSVEYTLGGAQHILLSTLVWAVESIFKFSRNAGHILGSITWTEMIEIKYRSLAHPGRSYTTIRTRCGLRDLSRGIALLEIYIHEPSSSN